YSDVGRLKREDGSKPLIALAGCVAQAEGAEAQRRSSLIDIVVGPQAYHRLSEMVHEASHGARPVDTDMPAIGKFDALPARRRASSHPADMTDKLIAAHGEVDKLMPYLHLPVQSGSNRILRAMNRSHTVESYLRTLEKARAARPDIALSGDFIVGFPGETEEDFRATLSIVDEVRYASAYSFKYSARPGTPAAVMEDQVPREVMNDRLYRLQERINAHQLAFNRSKV